MRLVPGAYLMDTAQPGDMVPLVVQSGRLNLDTMIRILAMNFAMGDDGTETVEVEVGRPAASLFELLTQADRDVDAIARRETIPTGLDAPVGAMYDWPGAVVPYSWQLADGGPLLRVNYPELFDVIGYTFGGAADTFNKPDCRGRVVIGTGQGTGLTNRVLAGTGGAETVALTNLQLGTHTHVGGLHAHNGGSHVHITGRIVTGYNLAPSGNGNDPIFWTMSQNASSDPGGLVATDMAGGVATTPAGAGDPHPNMPPFIALNKIIRVLPPTAAARRRRSAA